jgi:hypothetical protein
MTDRIRGFALSAAFVIAVVATVIDGINDGFSFWNWVTIACGVLLIPYGIALATGRVVSNRIRK